MGDVGYESGNSASPCGEDDTASGRVVFHVSIVGIRLHASRIIFPRDIVLTDPEGDEFCLSPADR
ncbi:hypothetical protein [Streptomyces sp. NPDC058953]|uniref:hypothetical protein n=1 Tax=unclassified Streptomyces TaxID=2593676 RepID=UPI0036C72827